MAETRLYTSEEMETSQVSDDLVRERNQANLLLNFDALQSYLTMLIAFQVSRISSDLISPAERAAVIEDLRQNAWLKLLQLSGEIKSLPRYLPSIARSVATDEKRRRQSKPSPYPLTDHEDQITQNTITSSGHQDPSRIYEEKEFFAEVVHSVVQLPKKQRYAMICILKEAVEDFNHLAGLFREHGIDIEPVCWPQDIKEIQQVRSLLSVARRRLRKKFQRPES